jgi:hypothetical protein
VGTALSIFGLGLLLWGIIEAPGRGWTSAPIMAALLAAGVVITSFVIWELHVDHPMLPLRFFTNRRYSAAIAALALVLFALVGVFFLITQYLQFALGYSPLEAGLRIAPIALVLLVVAPLSMVLARRIGSKAVVSSGMILIAIGLGILSTTTVHGTYRDCVIPFILLGTGVALALAPCTESVMGSLPIEEAGVGSATNDVSMQVGAALGVGVLGTALNLRYQHLMAPLVSSSRVPANVQKVIEGSLGGALGVAQRAPIKLGDLLAAVARQAFVSGMDLALIVSAVAVGVAALVVLVLLPNRGTGPTDLPMS